MRLKKKLSIVISLILLMSLVLSAATPVLAKSSREAVIETVVGEVYITKAGGSKSFRAFDGMMLNQGDHVETAAGSSVVLRIKDHDDEITIDENSSIYISELSEDTKGKKSKIKVWAGSLWGKVKTLTGTDDEFEVDTPTAVMGVRGTQLFVGVDPVTGLSKFFIASGRGDVNKKETDSGAPGTIVYPSQQLNLDKDTDSEDLPDFTNIVDIDDLVSSASSAIIQAIISNSAAIQQENEEYLRRQREGSATGTDDAAHQAELNRLQQNLDNIVGNIINAAITSGKVNEQEIGQLIDRVNQNLDKKIDLTNVKPIELSEAEKEKQAKIKQLEDARKAKQEADKLAQEALKKQNEALLLKLQQQLEKQQEEKKKAEEAAKKKAEEALKNSLDAAAKAALEAKLKALEDQKAKQNAAVEAAKAAPPAGPAAPGPGSQPPSDPGTTTVVPKLKMEIEQGTEVDPARVNIFIEDFHKVGIYGTQIHFTNDYSLQVDSVEDSSVFIEGEVELEHILRVDEVPEGLGLETIFAVTKYDSVNIVGPKNKTLLFSLNLEVYEDSTITLSKVIIVNKDGNKVYELRLPVTSETIIKTEYYLD